MSSLRSSCLVLVSFLIAETRSVAFAIQSSVFRLRCQPGLFQLGEPVFERRLAFRLEYHGLRGRNRYDAGVYAAHSRHPHVDVMAHKADPVAVAPDPALRPPAPDLEHRANSSRTAPVQPGL